MKTGDDACDAACGRVYSDLARLDSTFFLTTPTSAPAEVRDRRPYRRAVQVIVGPRSIANGEVEVKDRRTGARETMTVEAAINKLVAAR